MVEQTKVLINGNDGEAQYVITICYCSAMQCTVHDKNELHIISNPITDI